MKIENNRKIVRIKSLFLVLALVVGMLGSCFTVSASKYGYYTFSEGDSIKFGADYVYSNGDGYSGNKCVAVKGSDEVRVTPIYYCKDDVNYYGMLFVSKDNSFSYSMTQNVGGWEAKNPLSYETYFDVNVGSSFYTPRSLTTRGETFYFVFEVFGNYNDLVKYSHPYADITSLLSSPDGFEADACYYSYYAELNIGGGFSYSDFVSDDIEDVLGLFLNPYTGREDNETAYLWKWTPPVDTTLLMEISADVEYTDSLTDSLLTAIKNSWSTKHVSLFTYEDEILGSNGSIKFTYDDVKEKVAEEIGEEPQKIRLKNVYFRYAKIDEEESVVNYGNYTTFTPNYKSYMDVLPEVGVVTYPTGNHHSGVTENYDPKTDTIPETNVNISKPDDYEDIDGLFGTIQSYLNSGKSFIGDFPKIMGEVMNNIPPHITTMITLGLGLLIVLRLFGR